MPGPCVHSNSDRKIPSNIFLNGKASGPVACHSLIVIVHTLLDIEVDCLHSYGACRVRLPSSSRQDNSASSVYLHPSSATNSSFLYFRNPAAGFLAHYSGDVQTSYPHHLPHHLSLQYRSSYHPSRIPFTNFPYLTPFPLAYSS